MILCVIAVGLAKGQVNDTCAEAIALVSGVTNTVSTATMQITARHRPLSDGHGVVPGFSVGRDIVISTAAYCIFAQRIYRRRDGMSVSLPSTHECLHAPREIA